MLVPLSRIASSLGKWTTADLTLLAGMVLLTGVTFAVDTIQPRGFAGGVLPYMLVITLSSWMPTPAAPIIAAAITSFLTLFSTLFSTGGESLPFVANRSIVVACIWMIAALAFLRQRSVHRLQELTLNLEKEVDRRSASLREREALLTANQQRLQESEQRLRDFADAASDWFWAAGPDGCLSYLSERFTDVTALEATDQIGKPIEMVFGQPEVAAAKERFAKLLLDHAAFREVLCTRVEHDGGTRRYVRISGKPILDDGGNFAGYRGTGTDITEWAKLEERQRMIEHGLMQAIEIFPASFALFDPQDRLILCNKIIRTALGVDIDSISPKETITFRQFTSKMIQELTGITEDERANLLEWRLRRRKAPASHFEFNYQGDRRISLSDFILKNDFVITLGLDVTDAYRANASRRRTERRLQAIYDSSPAAIISIEDDGTIEAFSKSAESIFVISEADVLGKNISPWIASKATKEDYDTGDRWWCVPTSFYGQGRETRARRSDGSSFPAWVAVSGRPDDAGGGYLIFLRDVSDIKMRDAALHQAQKIEALGLLTGGVAHDFNNLLTVILGNIELLHQWLGGDERAGAALSDAREAAQLGAELVSRLLAFAHRAPMREELVLVDHLLKELAPLLRRLLADSAKLILHELPDAVLSVRTDPAPLRNALINLVINARDAMPSGGTVTITTKSIELSGAAAEEQAMPAGRYVGIEVRDDGEGISPEDQERVFEPFFTSRKSGTGLGLSIVHGLAKQSGGFTVLESMPGKGTTVTIWLPEAAPLAPTAIAEAMPSDTAPRGDGETVLVVEDEPLVRRFAVTRLEMLGYVVLEAACADEALELVEAMPTNSLLFTDVLLGSGSSGIALASKLNEMRPDIKVLFTSGYTGDVLSGGRDVQFLQKPCSVDVMARAVRQAFDFEAQGAPRTAGPVL